MKLLVGFDGSDGGRDALELARAIGAPAGADALVVAVAPAEPLFEEVHEHLTGLEVDCRSFGGGSAAAVMTEVGEAEDVDLIVVGSPHRGAIGRALIGSVAESLLHGAPCAVVVAPRGYASERHDPFRRIAVAYDGTPESTAALRGAEALATHTNAALEILTVVAPPVAMPGMIGYVPVDPPDPDKIVNEAIHSVDSGLAASGKRLDGPPARTLAEACKDGTDLLVAGSRGYGPVTRVLLGSVSTQLIHLAPSPVLVVPRP